MHADYGRGALKRLQAQACTKVLHHTLQQMLLKLPYVAQMCRISRCRGASTGVSSATQMCADG